MYPYDQQTELQNSISKLLMPQTQQQPVHTIKVNGRPGAENVTLPPDSDILVLDQNEPIVWHVQTDGAGYKTVTPFDISQHKEVKQEDMLKSFDERLTKLEEAMRNGKSYNRPNDQNPRQQRSYGSDAGDRSNDKG